MNFYSIILYLPSFLLNMPSINLIMIFIEIRALFLVGIALKRIDKKKIGEARFKL